MKKAQGLSLNMIVIAVIALVVLVVTIMVFTGAVNTKFAPFFSERTECQAQSSGAECVAAGDCRDGVEVFGLGCDEKNAATPYCCLPRDE